MQRMAMSLVALVALILGPMSPAALAASNSPKVDTSAVSFDMSSATCPNLPLGTNLHGEGTQVSITTVSTDARRQDHSECNHDDRPCDRSNEADLHV